MANPECAASPPVAVIDIGSNSIRLVVFEGDERAPLPVFNEKILCGLGRDLDRTGRLSAEGAAQALEALPRFVYLAETMGAKRIDLLATAAVREAENGPGFVVEIEKICGRNIAVLTGMEEARLAALGLVSGTPGANGIMGDLGGGSLELVQLDNGAIGQAITLPLGPLRFDAGFFGAEAKRAIDAALSKIDWLEAGAGAPFHAIGGAWRTLARLHMIHTGYPMHIVHHYRMPFDKAVEFTRFVSKLSSETLVKVHGLNHRRVETLPYAAMLMNRLLHMIHPGDVVMSGYGLREGWLFDRLPAATREQDPLIDACRRYSLLRRVSAVDGNRLDEWLRPAFPGADTVEARLRHAACLIADIGRQEHPDYRPEHALMRVLRFPFVGIDHHERAFLALAVASRYGRLGENQGEMPTVIAVTGKKERLRARSIGMAIRLVYTLSGGVVDLLQKFVLRRLDEGLVLEARDSSADCLLGDVVERRLGALAKLLDCSFVMRKSGNDAR